MKRKYLPSLGELVDRLSINQIKEVKIPDAKEQYAQEIQDIMHDIDLILQQSDIRLNAKEIRVIVVLAQMNLHIWENESKCRSEGKLEGSDLRLTHGLNGIRTEAKNKINVVEGSGQDHKIDCLAAEFDDWEISW